MRVIGLNIEGDRHLQGLLTSLPLLHPDVVLLQELHEKDLSTLAEALGMAGVHYSVMGDLTCAPDEYESYGIAVLTKNQSQERINTVYGVFNADYPEYWDKTSDRPSNCCLLAVSTEVDSAEYVVATTHGAWSPKGEIIPAQQVCMEALLKEVQALPSLILEGDFNTPRGAGLYEELSSRYRDCLPSTVTTSIDPSLHRAGALQLVVDGLFASSEYRLENVEVLEGYSDHKAIVADIFRN